MVLICKFPFSLSPSLFRKTHSCGLVHPYRDPLDWNRRLGMEEGLTEVESEEEGGLSRWEGTNSHRTDTCVERRMLVTSVD